MQNVLGLMSGTSLDGVDVALLSTDGDRIEGFGPTLFRAYDDAKRELLKAALIDARQLADRTSRPGLLREAERMVTDAHSQAIAAWRQENPELQVDLIGFHGQTVFHDAHQALTVQIGDGAALAKETGVPVVYDFRAADVAAGGGGAPFVPVYHRALVSAAGLAAPVAVINIGGVANITWIGADGAMRAGDTGPGNALIDDFVQNRLGVAFDRDGALAASGSINETALSSLMADPWFDEPFPKSLDRDVFSPAPVHALTNEDGAATLAAFTAHTIAAGIVAAGGAETIVIVGGGAHNRSILRWLGEALGAPVRIASELGWKGDFIEAQAFAYLAARSIAGLPLSFPETTGVGKPMTGGVFVRP